MDGSTGQQNYKVSGRDHGHVVVEQNPFDHSTAIARSDQRNCNPDRIAQWAANSATNPDSATGHGFAGYDSASYRNDMLVTSVAHETPGVFPLSHSDMMQAPSQILSMYLFGGVEETYPNTTAVTTGSHYPGTDVAFDMAQSHAFDTMQVIQGEHYANSSSMNNMAYQTMTTGGLYPGAAEIHPPMVLGNNDGGYAAEWDHQVMYQDNAIVSQPLEYSPASGLAPSMTSSFSQRSFLGQLPDTPVSMDLHEDWPVSESGPVNESIAHFRGGGAMQIQPPFDLSADSERFAFQNNDNYPFISDFPLSTIRSGNSFQRTPLSMDAWVGGPPEMIDQGYGFPSYPAMDGSRRSSDGEAGRNARENPLYKAVPQEDGLYHCPFEGKDGCSKSPEKLKCNYE